MRGRTILSVLTACLVIALVLLTAQVAEPQQPATATPTARTDFGWDPVRATLHAAFGQATARAATASAPTATRTPFAYTRGYDPLFLTLQAWVRTPTPTEPPCAWQWTSVPLDDETARVQGSIDAAGAEGVLFEASAFGENCVDGTTGDVRRFIARDIVYRISVGGADAALIGDALARALPFVNTAAKVESRPLAEIRILFTEADLDPVALTPAMLDRVLATEADGAALVARLYEVSLR